MPEHDENDSSGWSRRTSVGFAVFAIIAAIFLVAEHRAHVLPYLPWLLLAACPLMHVFVHRGHGGHGRNRRLGGGRNPPGASGEGCDANADGAPGSDGGARGTGHPQHGGRP